MFHMCANFRCLWSWQYYKSFSEVSSRTGIVRLWRNWAGYRRMAAWDGVMTLAMEVVCDLLLQAIGPGSISLCTLGCGGSTVCVTLDLVCCAMGSYFSQVNGNLGYDGSVLGVGMNTLGSEA